MARIRQERTCAQNERTTDDSANPSTRMRYEEERGDDYIGKTSGQVRGSGQAVPQENFGRNALQTGCSDPNWYIFRTKLP
jgi:hypothetical protein